jgi:hypothetical protein
LRLANFEKDYWELRDGEKSHEDSPDNFWIPEIEKRKSLKRGDAAKLIFDIENADEDGKIILQGERIFVIVSEVIGDKYIGILDSQPSCIEKGQNDVYLCFGAEIPFSHEHVIDIDRPSDNYIEWQLGQPPEREWARK